MADQLTTVVAPVFGQLGVPADVKETGQRADFRIDAISIQINSHGYRLLWTRATICPCVPLNDQTQQADPNCSLCQGAGFFYFGPTQKQDQSKIGRLTDVQAAVQRNTNAFMVRGLMTNLGRSVSTFEKTGTFVDGRSSVTVVPQNRLGYLDRLVAIDGVAVYTEKITAQDPSLPLKTHYLISGGVNFLATANHRYVPGGDFTIKEGRVIWFNPSNAPTPGTPLTIHYCYMPTYLVTSQPHMVRSQNVKFKTQNPDSPEGNSYELALQAEVMLEHLVGDNAARTLQL